MHGAHAFFAGQDWSGSPVGPPDSWPQGVQAVARLMAASRTAQFLAFGPALALVGNAAYFAMFPDLGTQAQAQGRPIRDLFAAFWPEVGPSIEATLAGESCFFQDRPFEVQRDGARTTAWFTFGYTPLLDDAGAICGLHCLLVETTESVLAERANHARLARLDVLFDETPGFVALLVGPEHRFALTNQAYLRLIGRQNVLGMSVAEALPELDPLFVQLLDGVYRTGEPYRGRGLQVRLLMDGGEAEERIVDFAYQPVVESDGRVSGIFVQGNDVTDYHTVARLAQFEQRRLDAILESIPSGMVYASESGAIVRANAANRAIWGQHPMSETADGYGEWKGWWPAGSPRQGERVQSAQWPLARALGGAVVRDEVVEIEPFGQPGVRKTVLLNATPVRMDDGTVEGAVVVQTEITDRVQAEARVRESEAKFRTIADAMPQMVWSTLPDGAHDYFNRRWYEFTGVPDGTTDGGGWSAVLHPDDQDRAWERWRHSLATGEEYALEYRLRHASGDYRWVLGRALPVRDADGVIVRWMGTCTDIHEQAMAQAALEASQAALREADRRKDEFLAMLAHELRNPLAPISTAADVLRLATADAAQVRRTSEIISRNVRHMTELVDDLLDVSRVTRGAIQLDDEVFDLRSAVHAAIEQARPLVEARRHALSTRIGGAPMWVRGDRTRLTQVVTNLLGNAAKYTPNEGEITLDLRAADGRLHLSVQDNGQGIEAALLPQVFDLFTQAARSVDRAQGGLGIGLALVRSLVDLHGGGVSAHSDGPGRGSTFHVQLPQAQAPAARPRPAPAGARVPAARLDVVVVDDNQDAAQTLAVLLGAHGHRVTTAHDAAGALALDPAVPVDVYLLDIGLPDLSGHDLARRLRADPVRAGARLYALTGYGQAQDRQASANAGFDAHFVKPVDPDRLLAVLEGRVQG